MLPFGKCQNNCLITTSYNKLKAWIFHLLTIFVLYLSQSAAILATMKTFTLFSILLITGVAHAAKLSRNLYGEWRDDCIRAVDQTAKDEGAPFIRYKMVLGWDGTVEHNYSRYSDD